MAKTKKSKLLLHSCCGPCSTAVIENLVPAFSITIFFYNPNITDKEEYEKRKTDQIKYIEAFNNRSDTEESIGFVEGNYETERFYEAAKGLEAEPEGGERCTNCFKLRLAKTAETALCEDFDCFATTLTVSPHKDYKRINQIGGELCRRTGIDFLDRDFKKGAGYQRSIELSKQYELYRQNYCGCEFAKGE